MNHFRASLLFLLFLSVVPGFCADASDPRIARLFPSWYSEAEAVKALERAYPRRISDVGLHRGAGRLTVDGQDFLWAGGRLIPEKLRARAEEFDPWPFYRYAEAPVPELRTFSQNEKADLESLIENRETNPPRRHQGFYQALYRFSDQRSAYDQMKTLYFLGKKVLVHRDILEDLARVEEELNHRRRSDRELDRFLRGLGSVSGYNWRTIAGTETLSFHSYGTAIDIQPKGQNRKQVYWRWTKNLGIDWITCPLEDRWIPPASFLRAFERQGFVWGGKWLLFDNIHFEYRPEILILNRNPNFGSSH